jgi:hypothetical protein
MSHTINLKTEADNNCRHAMLDQPSPASGSAMEMRTQ